MTSLTSFFIDSKNLIVLFSQLNMKTVRFLTTLALISFSPVFAESFDSIIYSNGVEYEIQEITKEYKLNKNSHITKTQGITTTGEMFFLRTSDSTNFEKVMILDNSGHWQKAQLKEKIIEIEPVNSVIVEKKTDLHILTDQYERVNNGEEYTVFVKTFDASIYSGEDFGEFQGKISGAKVTAIVIDPNGELKTEFQGFVENGLFEVGITVPENLWQRGWYSTDLLIEFEGDYHTKQLAFYVTGETSDSGGCPSGTVRTNGVCVAIP